MATYYAQLTGGNIDATNQWGNTPTSPSSYLTWANLAAGDVLCANGKTVVINVGGWTCARISTTAEGSGTASGGFTYALTSNNTITCDITAGGSTCLTTSHASGTLTLIGNITAGTGATMRGLYHSGTGNITVGAVGNIKTITGGGNATADGLYNNSTAALTLYANATAATGRGVYLAGNTTGTTIYGDITGTATVQGLYHGSSSGVLTVYGSIIPNAVGFFPIFGRFRWIPAAGKYMGYTSNGTTVQQIHLGRARRTAGGTR